MTGHDLGGTWYAMRSLADDHRTGVRLWPTMYIVSREGRYLSMVQPEPDSIRTLPNSCIEQAAGGDQVRRWREPAAHRSALASRAVEP